MRRFSMILVALSFALAGLVSPCPAAKGELNGVGIILGDTTGISYKHFMDRHTAFDVALGAPYGYNIYPGVSLHGDLMWTDKIPEVQQGVLLFHIGGGLGLGLGGSEVEAVLRVTTGLEYFFPRTKFAVFGDLVPAFVLTHTPGARLNAAIGVRYYF